MSCCDCCCRLAWRIFVPLLLVTASLASYEFLIRPSMLQLKDATISDMESLSSVLPDVFSNLTAAARPAVAALSSIQLPESKDRSPSLISVKSQEQPEKTEQPISTNATNISPKHISTTSQTFMSTQRVVMSTFIFGWTYWNKRRLQMFIATAKRSGFDFIIIGDSDPPFALPENFKFFKITWNELIDLVFDRLKLTSSQKKRELLYRAKKKKVCDYRPLFASLWPELVKDYEWWGHIDNDLLLGNLTKFYSPAYLSKYDIVSGGRNTLSWGPFMMYRNIPKVNTLWSHVANYTSLESIFAKAGGAYFDEWGNSRGNFKQSMSGMIKHVAPTLGLRNTLAWGFHVWDKGECLSYRKRIKHQRCGECAFKNGTLIFTRLN